MNQITKLLNKAIREKPTQISYYERYPLAQIHIDTMFYELTSQKKLIPILVVVDVATRYTQAYIQSRKNENIQEYIDSFVVEVRKKWKSAVKKDEQILIISDGAKEFNSIKRYRKKTSGSINKAAIAEAAIKRIRFKFRRIETDNFLKAIVNQDDEKLVDLEYLKTNLPKIIIDLNKSAQIRKNPNVESKGKFEIGDLVFVKSKEKFEGDKLGLKLQKQSYKSNYDPEPFIVNRILSFNGVDKYEVISIFDMKSLKYYYYYEELQEIPEEIASEYINNYNNYWLKKENVKLKKNKVDWSFLKK